MRHTALALAVMGTALSKAVPLNEFTAEPTLALHTCVSV